MGKAKIPATDYEALAARRGFKWLGPEAKNTMTKTGWQCNLGHIWYAPYNRLQKGSRCSICAVSGRPTDGAYLILANKKGITWLGPNVPERQMLTNWACTNGDHWVASYEEIEQDPYPCPKCCGKAK